MLYKHKRTGDLYRVITQSYSVERQSRSVVYMQLDTGLVFDREKDMFNMNFVLVHSDPQDDIKAHVHSHTPEMTLSIKNSEGHVTSASHDIKLPAKPDELEAALINMINEMSREVETKS